MHVVEAGNPTGPAALLVHGFLSSRAQWALNVKRLGAHLRLVIVELPGHGASAAPTDPEAYLPERVVPALDRIRSERQIDKWWVIGQSMGGAVAAQLVLSAQERVHGFVFTNSRAIFGVGRSTAQPSPSPPRTAGDLRDLPFHPVHAKRFPDDLKAEMVAVADAVPPHAAAHFAASASRWRAREALHQLDVPTLLVNGRWESAFQPHVQEARELIGGLEVVDLEGGHSINVEQAEAFDHAVLDFIDRHRPA